LAHVGLTRLKSALHLSSIDLPSGEPVDSQFSERARGRLLDADLPYLEYQEGKSFGIVTFDD